MKLKGKALLSLLLVLTLVTQLFTVSAAATGGESLVYALYLEDEYGQSMRVEDEAAIDYQSYSVQLGDWTTLSQSPSGVSLSQLMSETLRVTPPEGFYVARLWLYGSEGASPVALPLTAADPSQGGNARAVTVKPEALIGGSDYGTPLFNEQLLSSWSSDGLYTLGILLKRVAGGDVVIYDEYGNVRDYTATTAPAHPGDSGDRAFVGWQLRYDNNAAVLVSPGAYLQPYASCTLSAAYAPIITLQPRNVTVSEGTAISAVESSAQVDVYNLPGDLVLNYANAYLADAGDPLSAGAYSLRVGSYSITDRATGLELNDSSRAVVRCEDGVVTVEAAVVEQWVEPDSGNGQQGGGDSGWVEPQSIDLTPSATTVNVTLSDQGWTYTGTPDGVGYGCLSLDPWVEGAAFSFSYTDAWGNTTDSIVNAGEYTLNAVYTGGLDESQYSVNIVNSAKVTIYPRTLNITAASDTKQQDGSPLVNADYTAEGLIEGHSISNVSVSILDAAGNWVGEWPSAEGSYTKLISGVTVTDAYGSDVGGNYDIRTFDGTLTITAPPAPQTTAVTASLADQTLSYTGQPQSVDPANIQLEPAVSGAAFTLSYVDANGQSWDSVTNAGTYTMQLVYAGGLDANFYTVAIGSVGSLTVTPAALSVTAASASKTYDGTALVNTDYTANGLLAGHSFREGDGVVFALTDANGSAAESALAVGSYTKSIAAVHIVDGSGAEVTANYSITTESGTLSIAAAERQTVTVTVPERSLVYDGAEHRFDASILTVEPVVEGLQISMSILDQNGQTLESVTEVGSYTLQASYAGGLDPNLYEVQIANTAALTVTPYPLTVTAASDSKTYDGSALENTEFTASALLAGHRFRESAPVDFAVKDGSGNVIQGWPVQQGVYTKTATAVHVLDSDNRDVSANYALSAVDGTLTVSAPEVVNVTVTVNNQTWPYDGQPHSPKADEYSVQGLKDNDSLTVVLKAAQTNGAELESVTEAGSYVIKAAVSGYDTNKYHVTVQAGTLSVTPYEVTASAESASKNFDGKALENAGYTLEPALLSGHRISELRFKVLAPNGTLMQVWPSEEGVYTKQIGSIKVADASGNDVTKNYQFKLVNGTLTINTGVPAQRDFINEYGEQVTPRRDGSSAYSYTKKSENGLLFRINADPSLLKSVKVDNVEVPSQYYTVRTGSTIVILQPTYLDTLTSQQHVIRIDYTDNGYATTTFTIADASPAVSSVKFYGKNDTKAWDGSPYNIQTAYINRYYNNASIQSISFHLVQNGVYVSQATAAGTYDIYLDSLVLNPSTQNQQFNITVYDANGNTVATNYQNTSVKVGTLTITQTTMTSVRVTVQDQSWTYDGTAHQLNQAAYTVEGMQSGDPISVKLTIIDKNGRTLSAVTDAGTYSIKAEVSGYNAGKYTVTTAGVGTLNVNAYKLTLTAESASKSYDGTVLRNSNVKATGLLNGHKFRSGDGVKFSVYDSKGNLIQNGPVDVGTYTKKVTEVHIVDANNVEVTANYDITRVDGTLTIQQGNGSPKTGDQNRIGIWIALLAVSAVLVIVVAVILLRRSMKPRKKPQSRAEARARIQDDRPRGK